MANSFVTLRDIARTALPHLMNNLVFPRLVHCDFSDALAAKQGDTVQVRKPVNYVARDFDPDAGIRTQEVEEGSVEVKLDKIASVDIEVSALDAALNFDSVERLFIEPAAIALAEKLNADGLALYRDIAAAVGEAGKTPAELSDLAAVRGALNDALVPQFPRCAVWDTAADTAFATVPGIVSAEKSGSTEALREGAIGRVFGIDNYMSQAVVKHKTGITSAAEVTVKTKVAEGAQTLDLTGIALLGKLTAGDLLQIGGKTYTVTEDTAAASSNVISDVRVSPALPALAAGTAVTLIGSHTANLAFHPSAFAFVTRPLSAPAGVESYVTSFDGISLRVVRGYDMKYKREMLSMDVLYAYKTIYPELAVRCLG